MHGGNNQMLDFVENQMRGMEMSAPPMYPVGQAYQPYQPPQVYQPFPQIQPGPQGVPFTAGPPSMISALDEMGVRGVDVGGGVVGVVVWVVWVVVVWVVCVFVCVCVCEIGRAHV